MGGFGSGRPARGPTVETSLALPASTFVRQHHFQPGARFAGLMRWGTRAEISFEVLAHSNTASVRLRYVVNDGTPKDYRIWLESWPCHYGGHRWWWICPVSGRRATKLLLPPGATVFAHRKAYRLTYQSQRDCPIHRSHSRQRRIFRRLGGTYDHFEQPPPLRPKHMHAATYEQLLTDLDAAMEEHEAIFASGAWAIIQRMQRGDTKRQRL
jgi:hypothetical protein